MDWLAQKSAQLKLLAALPDAQRDGAERVIQRFHLDVSDWYQRRTVPAFLQAVATAVWAERRVILDYESWTQSSRRTVDHLGLVLKSDNWYLVALSGDCSRTYRLDKLREVQMLDEPFVRPSGFELARAWRDSVERFEASLRRETAQIRVASSCLDRLDRLGADIAERVLAAQADIDGWRSVVIPIESAAHAAGLMLGFGNELEVVAPIELRNEILQQATSIIEMYR